MSKQPFSFHCIICYEFLNPTDRPPVVLPCGHTYVCELCAKRLDKCMECRQPLTTSAPKFALAPQFPARPAVEPISGWRDIQRRRQQQNSRRVRGYYAENPPTRDEKPIQNQGESSIPLPRPKNLVLISLIESAMYGHKNELETSEGYESGDDDDYVSESLGVFGSTCGTYAVRDQNGLVVYDRAKDESDDAPKAIKTLLYGQTVQILSLEQGIATVARGAGFIHINSSSQLVKVGEPVDKSCVLQTAHNRVLDRISELEKQIQHILMVEDRLAGEVQKALADRENSDPFGPEPNNIPEPATPTPTSAQTVAPNSILHLTPTSTSLPPTPEVVGEDLTMPVLPESRLSPSPRHGPIPIRATQSMDEYRDMNPDDDTSLRSAQSTGLLEDARARLQDFETSPGDDAMLTAFGCGEIIPLDFLGNFTRRRIRSLGCLDDSIVEPPMRGSVSFGVATHDTAYQGQDHARPAVNFATGLSGHSGLNRASKPTVGTPQRQVRMMGEHRGVARIGPISSTGSTTAW